jgi:hypothetical protein
VICKSCGQKIGFLANKGTNEHPLCADCAGKNTICTLCRKTISVVDSIRDEGKEYCQFCYDKLAKEQSTAPVLHGLEGKEIVDVEPSPALQPKSSATACKSCGKKIGFLSRGNLICLRLTEQGLGTMKGKEIRLLD